MFSSALSPTDSGRNTVFKLSDIILNQAELSEPSKGPSFAQTEDNTDECEILHNLHNVVRKMHLTTSFSDDLSSVVTPFRNSCSWTPDLLKPVR